VKSVRDLENVYLMSKTQFDEKLNNYYAEFYKPITETWKASFWQGLPSEMKEQIRIDKPSAYREMERRYGKEEKRNASI